MDDNILMKREENVYKEIGEIYFEGMGLNETRGKYSSKPKKESRKKYID
ncbi:MAG: hypothetical protein E7E64_10990 [Clostridium celatum]|nr:hypothetical protein [Clostridium celatum]MDU4978787.1 hypothetical protein [Clostridium celatum]